MEWNRVNANIREQSGEEAKMVYRGWVEVFDKCMHEDNLGSGSKIRMTPVCSEVSVPGGWMDEEIRIAFSSCL